MESFLAQYRGRKPLHRRGCWKVIEHLLGEGAIADLAGFRELLAEYSQPIRRVIYNNEGLLSYRSVPNSKRCRIEDWETSCFFLANYDGHYASSRLLVEAMLQTPGYRSGNCKASFQTAGAGIPRHCDDVDVISIQLFGQRTWALEPNIDPPIGIDDPVVLPTRRRRGWSADFGDRVEQHVNGPGSVLYVPRGWWHETRSHDPSFALILALKPA